MDERERVELAFMQENKTPAMVHYAQMPNKQQPLIGGTRGQVPVKMTAVNFESVFNKLQQDTSQSQQPIILGINSSNIGDINKPMLYNMPLEKEAISSNVKANETPNNLVSKPPKMGTDILSTSNANVNNAKNNLGGGFTKDSSVNVKRKSVPSSGQGNSIKVSGNSPSSTPNPSNAKR